MIITSSLLHTNMASTPLALILLTLTPSLILILLTSQTQAQTPTVPAPAPANLTGILDNGGQYTTFIRLLIETQQITQIESQLNSTNSEGFTVFAPTDNAFQNLKSGAINDLTDQQKTQLILYHVAPTYYTLTQLLIVSNPVRTEASGSDGNWGLNFTSQGNQANVSTGVVETPINNALRQQFPLAVYQVDKVLLPFELFGAMSPASASALSPSPKSSNTENSGNNNTTKASSGGGGDNQKSDALGRNVGLGLVLGLGFICMGALS